MADNYCGCSGNGETPEYIINLNTQGPPGQQGPKGEQGYSPVASYIMTPDDIHFTFINEESIDTTPNFFQYVPKLDLSNVPNPTTINGIQFNKDNSSRNSILATTILDIKAPFINISNGQNGIYNSSINIYKGQSDTGNIVLSPSAAGKALYRDKEIATVDQIPSTSTFLKADGSNAVSEFEVNNVHLNDGVYINSNSGYIQLTHSNTNIFAEMKVGTYTGAQLILPEINLSSMPDQAATLNANSGLIINGYTSAKVYYHGSQPDNEVATIGDIPEVIEYKAGDNITFTNNPDGTVSINGEAGGESSYTLPPATTTTLGGIKVGTNLTIEEDGTLNAQAGASELDNYLLGNTTGNITTITAKDGKALELSAPTIAVGDNLVNNINGTDSQLYLKQGDVVAGTNVTVTKTSTGIVINSTGGGGSSTTEKYGIEGDYATHYGILDCPNGLIDYNATGKEITLNQGVVLQLAGQDNKTTIATAITQTLTSTSNITLFYGGGELLEVGKVDYSLEEPTDNGVDNYQAWYNPIVGKWQFKSNDTGNIWIELIATPIANIYMNDSNITRVDYIGYRILDDDILVQQSEIETLNEAIATLTNTINNQAALIENLTARVLALETNINGGNA